MSDQTAVLVPDQDLILEPQDRRFKLNWTSLVGIILSLLVVAAALYQMRHLSLAQIVGVVPLSPAFWLLFAAAYLVGPVSEYIVFRRIWGVGVNSLGALLRKLIYNELLLGYLGEAYFYGWARKRLYFVAAPFGAVKDLALLSAVAGNLMTLVFLLLVHPHLELLPIHEHAEAITWSLAFLLSTSFVILYFRRSIFSLERADLTFIFAVQIARILATVLLSAALWHLVFPQTPIALWFILATIRLLISRLPFVPNKDVVFAGAAILLVGNDGHIAALMTAMAALILSAHLLIGIACASADFIEGSSDEKRIA